ncbi:tyrosine-tyramine antiporter [Paenibacillus apiarius]|uniref:Tyrosine-tyramine antiporter n=1 Tax=Paenibacillus apiarius TaxID=46240 RepID=A0ABT4DV59_9BACL|nr:tyrosine-tyramine antiporter [Paenibacillus apiarius]MCY9514891.1 tyrosine-tyramine antiporter [Paenibacillus apiarius]MCY9521229.1 tyrosine-tyramine antiporter [Paenibacillus apiarius]MCY9555465.1 tyrosine-tyramine antiporter [Paenibacillus apiarius]MCY9560319.1 tyrosine-tyramine antiporter [Paenibacillus apiarius]MCY9685669.1 tyrosine-tyramine antiporter [Paenibacillus apiarius]
MPHSKNLTLFGLIGITMAFFGTVRSVPTLSITGWTQIFYMLVAAILFALPIALMSAELSTGFPEEGGPQVWVKNALGQKWGFVTSWLLWVQMFFGMVMVASTVGILLGYVINVPELSSNNYFIFTVILISYWTVTLLNLKFDMVKIAGSWGAIIGVYIPFVILVVLGVIYMFKNGIQTDSYLGHFKASELLPNLGDLGSLTYLSGIIFIFAGVEISSVHANEIENPKRNYPIAVIASVILLVIFNLIAGLTVSNAVPMGTLELANITQPYMIFSENLGLPPIFVNIISAMILIGVLVQLSAWVLGPSKSMIKVADEGSLPPFFQKRTKKNIPITFVMIQAIVISIVSVLYIVVPDVNSAFLIMTITTTILYCIVYALIAISAIRLRYKMPQVKRSFRLGSNGNGLMWFVSLLSLLSVAITLTVSLIPPSILDPGQYTGYIIFQVAATIVMVGIALMINKLKKPSWKKSE